MKFSIITPCFNSEALIAETIKSVLTQSAVSNGTVDLEYIIIDGKSSDNTVKIINSFKSPFITLISEKDSSMYDALQKGLKIASGDICAYINAGDLYNKDAFDMVVDIFSNKMISWLSGLTVYYNEKSQFVSCEVPFRYKRRFFECGLYGKSLPFLQQETTFWRTPLNKLVDMDRLARLKYAGDYYLWFNFVQSQNLYVIPAYLGGFKIVNGQLSENLDKYFQEVRSFTRRASIVDRFMMFIEKILLYLPKNIQRKIEPTLLSFNHKSQKWL